MLIHQQIEQDYLTAFKAHDQARVDVLRLVKAAIKNAEIDLRKHELTDAEATTVLMKEAKKRKESIAMYRQGNRPELAAAEEAELTAISSYLPTQISDEEIAMAVGAAVAELKPTPKDFGRVMSAVMAKIKGQADGNRVAAAVKQLLK
ncbi:MAG: GatB/YqeY domain-containing protein [Patescibacteria group bacterium]